MIQKIVEHIKTLSPLFGPSTREWEVQNYIGGYLNRIGYESEGDSIGNLWSGRYSGNGLRCALVGHADEIGVQITSIEEPGIARFRKIGGLRASSLIGHKLKFRNSAGSDIVGIIGSDPMLDNGQNDGLLIKTSDLWIDIGAESRQDFESRLTVGSFGVFDIADADLISNNRISGKALDDRCGLAVALEVFKQTISLDFLNVVFVSTVQEEINLYGAKALPIDVDVAIVFDVDFCSDTPSVLNETTRLSLGKGCGICISADNSPVLLRLAKEVAFEKGIPLQTTVGRNFSGGTDAAALRLKKDVTAIVIGIPLRYMHTAREIVDLRDLEYAYELAIGLLQKLASFTSKSNLIPWKRNDQQYY